jgi:hypothetical protein
MAGIITMAEAGHGGALCVPGHFPVWGALDVAMRMGQAMAMAGSAQALAVTASTVAMQVFRYLGAGRFMANRFIDKQCVQHAWGP